ncbi:hypothetical protein PL9214670016 [Planktothrix tepida PCC 9214]|uniref:Uncharacterized protein n=1 Tax=Planktothrix tepida PCC 9214 TaxID=671072 RepID=A0A1J1LT47_9CYAN|nr:hypothetical protein PL9214670016 [Planktothrix tepida PCC 9214]
MGGQRKNHGYASNRNINDAHSILLKSEIYVALHKSERIFR